jgi:hypothetical protein
MPKKEYPDPSEYMVLLYSPKKDENAECVISAVTVNVKVDPSKNPNYGLIERKAKEFLAPMGTEFRASQINAVGWYPRAGY